jgi:hypothetical protein
MDPTKSFDHLDPKLKETYARVMGTDTSRANTSPAPQNAPQPAQDTTLSASPMGLTNPSPQSAATPGQNQFSSSPFDLSQNPTPNTSGPNPGTGPAINTLPVDTPLSAPAQDTASPSNTSFFLGSAEPQQPSSQNDTATPVEPVVEPVPVTPYSPENFQTNQNPAMGEQMSQPLPSPASVNQAVNHETSALLKVLYIIGAVVFFAVYTLFWVKVFGLPIPFLSS